MATYTCMICGHVYSGDAPFESLGEDWCCPVCTSPKKMFEPGGGGEVQESPNAQEASKESGDARYVCSICGHVYEEDAPFDGLDESWCCPVCTSPKYLFEIETGKNVNTESAPEVEEIRAETELDYPQEFARHSDEYEPHMRDIHEMAVSGKTIIEPMRTRKHVIGFDDILLLGAQLNPSPLLEDEPVNTQTVIGKHAKKPMVLETPIYISHMSFGALSREVKTALAMGSAKAKTAMCSGEGGILKEEKEAAYRYVFEYVPNLYSVTDENLNDADAIEIKIGQGTKPGMGGHLPGEKVTEEVAGVRGKPAGEDIISPSRFEDITTKEDLKKLVDTLRERSEGRPVGIKIAAGRIEQDMEHIAFARPDFVTIDGRGGATGASPKLIRDATSVPTVFALHRARKFLDENGLDIDLVITGGLRVSTDFAKALAMGANAVAIASAALMAAACQQYRICNSGNCPMGVATQDPKLRKRLNIEQSAERVYRFLSASTEELKTCARITGKNDVHSLGVEDLATVSTEISAHTNIAHV
ncbi:MAG: glutamate synthase-related protein [Christensenellaceae bacterium]|jgi:glutamate synthase domain-containing protein 2